MRESGGMDGEAAPAVGRGRRPEVQRDAFAGRYGERLRAALAAAPTLALAGNALDGVGLPACVKSGYDAVDKVLNDLGIAVPKHD